MKTAIDPASSTAAEAQLFGYEAIRAGETFHAHLDFNDDIHADIIDIVCNSLKGTIRIGRSRSAQYGTATCLVEQTAPPTAPSEATRKVTFLLVSDLAQEDAHGMPGLYPLPETFGLDPKQCQFVGSESFLRFRHYSPYNMARKSHDAERNVIRQGSVITFKMGRSIDARTTARWVNGIGNYRYNGLGQVLVDPQWLREPPSPEKYPDEGTQAEKPDDNPLVIWLMEKVDTGRSKREDRKLAEKLNKDLMDVYESAREYAGEPPGSVVGPGRTQWGLVLDAGKRFSDKESLIVEFQKICRLGDEGRYESPGTPKDRREDDDSVLDESWGRETGITKFPTFGRWLLKRFHSEEMNNAGHVAANLARLAMDTVTGRKTRHSSEKKEESHDSRQR